MLTITSRVIATSFALTSFAAAIAVGVWADNTFHTIVFRALFTMIVCYMIGRVLGCLAERTVCQHIQAYQRDFPIPGDADTGVSKTPPRSPADAGRRAAST